MASSGTQQIVSSAPEQQSQEFRISPQHRWEDLGLVLLVSIAPLIFSAVLALIYWPMKPGPTATTTKLRTVSNLLHEIISLVVLAYVLRRQGRSVKSIGLSFRWSDPFIGIILAIGGLFLSTILSIVVRNASFFATGSYGEMRDPRLIFVGATPLLFLTYGVASAIFEETIVRGFLMTEMLGLNRPAWMAALASVVLQTSYHLYYGVSGALSLAGVFLVSALYFAQSRRLLPIIIGHACVDFIAMWSFFHR